ncbi:MAG: 3-methylcrotonyl-CoA carboxylase, partial [Kofleriaceae bacterium]
MTQHHHHPTSRPIHRVLVANRGEIACRILRTCRAMGLGTVAVYSDADAHAPHLELADVAVRLGPPPARESYLAVSAIIEAAKATGADAIHPGYGFLSENAAFARAVVEAGLVFVGPSPMVIHLLGSKREAKLRAQAAGVPTVPGYTGEEQATATLVREAKA